MDNDKSSIELSGYPLAFRVEPAGLDLEPLPLTDGIVRIRTIARTLEGMQKEAVIQYGPTGAVWRVVCDEGPWLNGTDLAPFPLAFFTSGVAASLMSEFVDEAGDRDVQVDTLSLVQDNFFVMEGSALRGTMMAGVQGMQVSISARGNASAAEIEDIAEMAVRHRSPVQRCFGDVLQSGFAIHANGEELPWPGKAATGVAILDDPAEMLRRIRPASQGDMTIIRKSSCAAETTAPAVGLQAEQKRVVHVRTEGTILGDGLKSISVQCIKPPGSRFEILSDNSKAHDGQGRAPNGLVYLSAGVAFCFMTQIGRYAQITKQKLSGFRIIQDTGFRFSPDGDPAAQAVETLVCLDTGEPPDKSIQLVRMGEQTCYIHATYRTATETELSFHSL